MDKRTTARAGLVLVAILAMAGAGFAQTGTRTESADIKSESGSFNWATGEFTLSTNVVVTIVGANAASVTAPRMTGKLSKAGDQILSLVAYGPVRMEITTPPDEAGGRARITGTAKDRAEYSETTQKILLYGGAVADYVSLPEGPESRRAHFSGEVIEADLKTSVLTVTKAHITVNAPLQPPSAPVAPAEENPAPEQ